MLLLLLASCSPVTTVMVIEILPDNKAHVVGMKDNFSDVVELPKGVKEGDIIKIKQ